MATYLWPAVSVTTLPPVGGATSANQVLEIADLDAINSSTAAINAKTAALVSGRVPVDGSGVTQPVSGSVSVSNFPATQSVSGTVTVTGVSTAANQTSQITQETAINTVLGTQADAVATSDTGTFSIVAFIKRGMQNWTSLLAKIPVIGTQSRAASLSVTLASDTNLVSINNSSTTVLAANAVFTGTSDAVSQYSEARIYVISNVASATNGLSIQQSSDGTNWDITDTYSISAAAGKTYGVGISGSFFRIVYTNGATLQASFRIQVIYHAFRTKPSSVRTQDARDNENDMEEVSSYVSAFNGSTWDRVRAGITGAVSVVTGYKNMIWVGKFNSTPPTLTNGQFIEPQFDVNGNLKTVAAGTPSLLYSTGAITQIQQAVGVTLVRATVAGTAPSSTRKRLSIKPSTTNTGRIFIGSSSVTISTGLEIVGPDRLDFLLDGSDYYLISDTAAQVVEIIEVI